MVEACAEAKGADVKINSRREAAPDNAQEVRNRAAIFMEDRIKRRI